MSEREQAKQIIDTLPDYKMQAILMFLRGVEFDDELEDDRFCEKLVDDYLRMIRLTSTKASVWKSSRRRKVLRYEIPNQD